ncbi:hypothetical protein PanWU01x14_369220, partial [Parasponia andersonii]
VSFPKLEKLHVGQMNVEKIWPKELLINSSMQQPPMCARLERRKGIGRQVLVTSDVMLGLYENFGISMSTQPLENFGRKTIQTRD